MFEAIEVTKPYEFIGCGAIDVTTPYEFIGCGAIDVTKPYEFIGFGSIGVTNSAVPRGGSSSSRARRATTWLGGDPTG